MELEMLHSLDPHGLHDAELQMVKVLDKVGDNDYIVITPAGVKCHALFNPFCGYYFADDVYRVVHDSEIKRGEQDHDR